MYEHYSSQYLMVELSLNRYSYLFIIIAIVEMKLPACYAIHFQFFLCHNIYLFSASKNFPAAKMSHSV